MVGINRNEYCPFHDAHSWTQDVFLHSCNTDSMCARESAEIHLPDVEPELWTAVVFQSNYDVTKSKVGVRPSSAEYLVSN